MSPAQIVAELAEEGIGISVLGGDLKLVGQRELISPEKIQVIKRHKHILIDFLRSKETVHTETTDKQVAFKQYRYPDGQILSVSRDEFFRVVDAVRLLVKMDNEREV